MTMESTVGNGNKEVSISAEEVITKLKDDGDFDKLRLKIIQKLKENEELRNNIISTVKQSATLNRAGANTLKPRELSDAIHEEIGNQMTSQISDTLWGVIRSSDGMKNEISETVECVYNRLLNPKIIQEPVPAPNNTSNEEANPVVVVVMEDKEDQHVGKEMSTCEDDPSLPPGFGDSVDISAPQCGDMDEDPDVPPGFG